MKVINLTQLVHMLSDMLDLVGVTDLHHSKRVAYMCLETGRIFGFDAHQMEHLYQAALLHDCGVSTTSTHYHIIKELDWPGADEHAMRGSALLESQPLFKHLSPIILLHHTHWQDLIPGFTKPVTLMGNLIHLCDRADSLMHQSSHKPWLAVRNSVRDTLVHYRGSWFDPGLLAAFLEASHPESFWLRMQPQHLSEYKAERELADPNMMVSTGRLRYVAKLAAEIVDTKSHYTACHSLGVARFSAHLAEKAGFESDVCGQIEIAGLLHDIGKMRVPDSILEKPASLSFSEKAVMLGHSFESYQILHHVKGFEDIARWGSYHHETLTGDGYPFHLKEADLDKPARIIAIADIFQAMTQERPYRPAKDPETIITALDHRVSQHKIDPDLVSLVKRDFDHCWDAAAIKAEG
ncbi:MAG TPA: HD domain-containing phosphohydrolase [Anaerolineales bacterium]|nr:HD domain-containing phosphohydrolase [Anaerolineales bacterium]